MKGLVNIQGKEIQIKEYKGKRVVTFKDIDTVHQRVLGTANKRFLDNRKRFISGVDFFKISPSEFRNTIGYMNERQQNDVTLITESGYLMLVKSFTDDLAWKVQRELVDSYFRVREVSVEPENKNMLIDTDKLIQIGSIMAGCLEGNRPYVLNIFKNIIPNIDEVFNEEIKEVSVKCEIKRKKKNTGTDIFFDYVEMDRLLKEEGISRYKLQSRIDISASYFDNLKRRKICEYFNVGDEYFDRKH